MTLRIRIKSVRDAPAAEDGYRVLVDRLWPRGVRKDAARLDEWAKGLAPSTALRQWFGHDPAKFGEFRRRYLRELADRHEAVEALLAAVSGDTLTLVYGAADPDHNQAVVLRAYLVEQVPPPGAAISG